jgi:hypothetical protein
MRFFIKILLFTFTVLAITMVEIKSSTAAIILQKETSPLNFSYDIVDGFALMVQAPFSGPTSKHLTGVPAVENDIINGYASTLMTVLPSNRISGIAGTAAKGGVKLLNQFNSAESLIQGAGKLSRIKGAQQGFVKGNVDDIFKSITQGGKPLAPNRVQLPNGPSLQNTLHQPQECQHFK